MRLKLNDIQNRVADLPIESNFKLHLPNGNIMFVKKVVLYPMGAEKKTNFYAWIPNANALTYVPAAETSLFVYSGEIRGLMAIIAEYRSYVAPSRRKLSDQDFEDFIDLEYENVADETGRVHIKDLYQAFNDSRHLPLEEFKSRLLELHNKQPLVYQFDRGTSAIKANDKYGITSNNGKYCWLKIVKDAKPCATMT